MYCLAVIQSINAPSAKKPAIEDNSNRHCSYLQSRGGIVLHSASLRSTGFIGPAASKRFLAEWFGTNSQTKRDAIVESYFRAVPTGKQRIRS